MTTADAIYDETAPPKDAKLIHRGRYKLGDKTYQRVTNFAKTVADTYNLDLWRQRMLALGLAARQDLYAQVASHKPEDKQALNALCEQAIEAARASAGANLGSALHRFTERVDRGEDVKVPEPWDADIDAYRKVMSMAGVKVVPNMIERVIVCEPLGIAGTFDRLVRLLPGSRTPVVADLKTGRSVDFAMGEIAIQLACYANATGIYNYDTGQIESMPRVDKSRAVVIHLPAGQGACTLYDVDIKAGWEAAQLCAEVLKWRKRKNLAAPLVNAAPATSLDERVEWLRARVKDIVAVADAGALLARSWPAGVPTLKASGHTAEHIAAIAAVCDMVEAALDLPFGDGDPASATARRAASQLLADGWDKSLVRALRDTHQDDVFPAVVADLLAGRSVLRFFDDGSPVVVAFNEKETVK